MVHNYMYFKGFPNFVSDKLQLILMAVDWVDETVDWKVERIIWEMAVANIVHVTLPLGLLLPDWKSWGAKKYKLKV